MSRRSQSPVCPATRSIRRPVQILRWQADILELDELTAAEKAAAIRLSHYINGDAGYSWAGSETIADTCKVSADVVRRMLRKLESLGLVRTEHRPGTSSRHWLANGPEVAPEVETPRATAETPPALLRSDLTRELATPPNPPEGGYVDKSTRKAPAPTPPATRATPVATPVYPRVRRSRRTEAPFVRAACHCDAPSEYLAPPPPRTDRRAAAAAVGGLRAALGVARA
jgi:hypothetical protein